MYWSLKNWHDFSTNTSALIKAILDGNNELSRELITQGVNTNVADYEGRTPLMCAAFKGNKEIAEILIDAGSEVNQRNHNKQTALLYSIANSNEEVARLLIEKGADVNVSDKYGQTPIFEAAKNSNEEVARMLIEKGADVNESDKYGQTPIFEAAKNSNEEVARMLIEKGADVNVSDKYGNTPLLHAAGNNNEEAARLLIEKGADVNASDENGQTPLFYAVRNKNEEVAGLLVEKDADVNACKNHGETKLLHLALNYQMYKTAKKLLELNATDMDAEDDNGRTAIFHLIGIYEDDIFEYGDYMYGDTDDRQELTRKVASSCSNIDKRDNQGRTALSYAIERMNKDERYESPARMIIDAGANVNLADDKGQTPLFYALRPSAVRLLLGHGGDLNLRNNQQETALIHILSEKDYFRDSYRYFNYYKGSHLCEQYVSALLNYVDATYVKARDMYGRTAIFYAVKAFDDSKIFEVIATKLVRKGAVVDDTDNNDMSVLSYFVERYCYNSFKDNTNISERLSFFIKNGIRNSAIFTSALSYLYAILPNYFHSTLNKRQIFPNAISVAYTYASHEVQCIDSLNALLDDERIPEALDALKRLGVNPNSANSYGNTALHYATLLPFHGVSQENVKKVLETLRNHGIRTNIRNQEKETPLHFCLSEQAWKLASEKDTWSGIMTVVEICEFLLQDGSLISETTRSGKTVYHLIMELLRRGLSMNNGKIQDVVFSSAVKLLEMFSKATGKDLTVLKKVDHKLNSPLHLWASLSLPPNQNYYGDPLTKGFTFQHLLGTIFKHLWKPGMSPNPRNDQDQTPLHLCKTWTATKRLIEAGADTHALDTTRKSPLLNVATEQLALKLKPGLFFPDVEEDQKTFFETCVSFGLDICSSDNEGQSILTILLRSEVYELANALIEVACVSCPSILKNIVETICKDESTRANWKQLLIEKILNLRTSPSDYDLNDALFHCCTNIKKLHDQGQRFQFEDGSQSSEPPPKKRKLDHPEDISSPQSNIGLDDTGLTSVHLNIARQLLLRGADNKLCMGLCENFPELHSFLTKKVDPDSVPMIIPWTSFTKAHVDKLKRVSRKQNVGTIGTYWFHKEPIGGGSFGHVFVGINEKDGREIAIKKIEKLRLVRPEDQREIRNLTALADCQQVVSYIFFDDSDKDFVYTVLELMEGHLDDYFASSWFNVSRSVLLCKDIVEGLSYLHGQKPKPILHRDLKPGNILYKLHPNLCLKIADFGLSSPLTTVGTTVLGTNVGTRCWIAPEVISSSTYQHSPSSDVFSCGLLVHYILSKQKHPFSPADCSNKSREVIDVKTQSNMLSYNMDGWDKFLTPEATHLIKGMLQQDPSHRPCAGDSLSHPLFWTQKKKMDFLCAVGNQYEFECPSTSKAASHHKPTAVETDLQNNFSIIVRYAKWDNPNYKDMAKVVAEMKKTIKKVNKKGATYFQKPRTYDTGSVVELVRFIRNANNHVSERSRPPDIKKLILEDFVFLKEFPYLLMEVYKAVTTHGWDPREEIKYAMADQEHQP